MRSSRRRAAVRLLVQLSVAPFALASPRAAVAQPVARPIGVVGAASSMREPATPRADDRRSIVTRHALIGAGLGAVAGLAAAVASTHQAGVIDHSEDAIAYIFFVPAGTALGLITGLVVGVVRASP